MIATVVCAIIGFIIGYLSHHIVYFTIIGILIGYRYSHKPYIVTVIGGILGVFGTIHTLHPMATPMIGLIMGFIIDHIIFETNKKEEEEKKKKEEEEEYEFWSEKMEKQVNENLSKYIREYLKTGKVNQGYYCYSDHSCCSVKVSREINELINFSLKILLSNVKNSNHYKDHHTKNGIIRKVYICKVLETCCTYEINEVCSKGKENFIIRVSDVKNDTIHWRELMRNSGFQLEKEFNFGLEEFDIVEAMKAVFDDIDKDCVENVRYIYAYIKL